ncbi:MAG: tRNA lysidine(34) synthetase TilS [Chloroflexi bacterium]|nr:tRNA lysidine(34) synthetase TilS [Chloroflexota bacterium]
MLQIIQDTIRQQQLFPAGSVVVVAVSGGADSLALLHVLRTLAAALKIRLHAATLDHGLRGEAGAADARFVVEQCRAWGIPVTVESITLASDADIEAQARRARYAFLARAAQQVGASLVAVAHHADDQAETVLLRLLRGSGTFGLRAMAFQVPYVDGVVPVTIVRPLLAVTRAQIESYCRENGLTPRHDATNDDTDYTRNYLRHEIMPRLLTINPQAVAALCRLAQSAALEQDLLDSLLPDMVTDRLTRSETPRVTIERSAFVALHPALQRRWLHAAVTRLGHAADASYERIVAAVQVALTGQVGARVQFPHGLWMRVDYQTIVLETAAAQPEKWTILLPENAEIMVNIPGDTSIPGAAWSLRASLYAEQYCARLALPAGARVLLRTRRRGERFAPLGLGGHTQKLSEWLIDHKVPRALRDSIPLLVVNGQVAAILYGAQWPIAESFKVGDKSEVTMYFDV